MKYEVEKICFGKIFYDLGYDGVYFSSPRAFEEIDVDGKKQYRDLASKTMYNERTVSTGKKGGLDEKVSLVSMIENPDKKFVSRSMIRLYLLKHILLYDKKSIKKVNWDEIEKSK